MDSDNKNKIKLKDFKTETEQIISELEEINIRFNRLNNNSNLKLEEYKIKWGRLLEDKKLLLKRLEKLSNKEVII